MTYRQLYLTARRRFQEAGIDSPGTDAALLLEHRFGLSRPGLALRGEECPSPAQEEGFLRDVAERAAHRPLQYILGEWEFMGLSLAVGEGVLVPREDTAVLVETLAQGLEGISHPRGLDLCAGTGAVALGLLTLLPESALSCVELSQEAFPYLEENLRRYGEGRVKARRGDVLSPELAGEFAPGSLDFLASNPPYIETGELSTLQPEVQNEPSLALDGGADGLVFYRAIAQLWLPKVKPGGLVAVEIGETQGESVSQLFARAGVTGLEIHKDWANLPRVVSGRIPSHLS